MVKDRNKESEFKSVKDTSGLKKKVKSFKKHKNLKGIFKKDIKKG